MKSFDVKDKFLLSGCGRDGTTLLWRILNSHIDLNILWEPYYGESKVTQEDMDKADGFKNPMWGWTQPQCAKYIFMTRNPIDTTYSLCTRAGLGIGTAKETHRKVLALYENFINQARNHEKTVLLVPYEKLCQYPHRYTRKCCLFLGVDYYPELLEDWKDCKAPKHNGLDQIYTMKEIKNCNNRYKENQDFKRRLQIT